MQQAQSPFPLIAWDVDDVLNDLTRQWFVHCWLPKNPASNLTYEDLTESPPHEKLGMALDVYLHSLDEFRLSTLGQGLQPCPQIKGWFEAYGHKFRHMALTARPLVAVPEAARWVFTHFGTWIRSFHFVPSPRKDRPLPHYCEGKAAYLKEGGIPDFFVDDSPHHVQTVANLGVKAYLLDRPWNDSHWSVAGILKDILKA